VRGAAGAATRAAEGHRPAREKEQRGTCRSRRAAAAATRNRTGWGVRAMGTMTKTKLPLVDVDAELRQFEEEERKRLGLDKATDQWVEQMANLTFTKSEKPGITLLIGGLTVAQDYLIEGGLRGIGYNVQTLDVPTNAALQFG